MQSAEKSTGKGGGRRAQTATNIVADTRHVAAKQRHVNWLMKLIAHCRLMAHHSAALHRYSITAKNKHSIHSRTHCPTAVDRSKRSRSSGWFAAAKLIMTKKIGMGFQFTLTTYNDEYDDGYKSVRWPRSANDYVWLASHKLTSLLLHAVGVDTHVKRTFCQRLACESGVYSWIVDSCSGWCQAASSSTPEG